ncbi:PPC domain-containing DNA-binding protein [Humibacter albus]|jgi:predicted DNA-binding protein with PD1-like motif|uniref:PPC domain-containing DNA-binding protein n=1 Tax=Humibacter albus TaxID=427754 RepID=UPI0003B3EB25|nr:PPC domain-containing DNA-binding protein [Humibacter albus]
MQYTQIQPGGAGETPRRFAVVFETGDELFGGLGDFVKKEGIDSASFTAIGALAAVRLAWFDWEAKEYRVSADLDEQVELVSLVGDVADHDGKPEVHAHAVIARSNGQALGGHLRRATVRPTCEVMLTEAEERLRKRMDPESGLPLIRME